MFRILAVCCMALLMACSKGDKSASPQPEKPSGTIKVPYFVDKTNGSCAVCRDPYGDYTEGCCATFFVKNSTWPAEDTIYWCALMGGDGRDWGYNVLSTHGLRLSTALLSGRRPYTWEFTLSSVPTGTYSIRVSLIVGEPVFGGAELSRKTLSGISISKDTTVVMDTIRAFQL